MNVETPTDAVLLAGAAAVVSLVATGVAVAGARRAGHFDLPNERSSHVVPTPRVGGVGIILGIVIALIMCRHPEDLAVIGAIAVAAAVGFWDDRRSLRPVTKYCGLLVAAYVASRVESGQLGTVREVPYWHSPLFSPGVTLLLSLFWLTAFPNTFNFMDGLNGIASLTAIVSSAVYAFAALRSHDAILLGWAAAATGASMGFLPWNFPRAITFLGDGGSLSLGLLLAMCATRGEYAGALSFPASVLLLGPFVFDVAFTLVRRAVERKRIGEAHKEHLYQRLSRLWGSHARVSLLYASFSVVTGALALEYDSMDDVGKLLSLVVPLAAMLGFAALVLRAERRKGV